jgi:hypothetical protein
MFTFLIFSCNPHSVAGCVLNSRASYIRSNMVYQMSSFMYDWNCNVSKTPCLNREWIIYCHTRDDDSFTFKFLHAITSLTDTRYCTACAGLDRLQLVGLMWQLIIVLFLTGNGNDCSGNENGWSGMLPRHVPWYLRKWFKVNSDLIFFARRRVPEK